MEQNEKKQTAAEALAEVKETIKGMTAEQAQEVINQKMQELPESERKAFYDQMYKALNGVLHQEFEDALAVLEKKLYNLLHYGSYQMERVSRDFETNKLSFAVIKAGNHRMILQSRPRGGHDGTTVEITFDNNPVNDAMLDNWDRQLIQIDIDYHKRELESLMKRKEELGL